ncbi:MAG: polysaccharide biosynthesis C-terminal domain-containing protein, partial [Clostridiales bacterium]|nr:polysaccharide biosynthesis C-terminal domain-containing protein [Clostridiales bacterium]
NSNEAIPVIAPILVAYGICTPLFAISTPITNMLQAVGRADIPMKTVGAAAVCKILCNFILVGIPGLNIYGAVIGTILFYVIIVSVNLTMLVRVSKVRINIASVFVKPLIAALVCGLTAFACHGAVAKLFPGDTTVSIVNSDTIGTLIAVVLAAFTYIATLLLIKGVVADDISGLPGGEKAVSLLSKWQLID